MESAISAYAYVHLQQSPKIAELLNCANYTLYIQCNYSQIRLHIISLYTLTPVQTIVSILLIVNVSTISWLIKTHLRRPRCHQPIRGTE